MGIFPLKKERETSGERAKLLKAIKQAQKEYDIAYSYFTEATEPDIIDQAIFLMEAARKKYGFFLKKMRDSQLS